MKECSIPALQIGSPSHTDQPLQPQGQPIHRHRPCGAYAPPSGNQQSGRYPEGVIRRFAVQPRVVPDPGSKAARAAKALHQGDPTEPARPSIKATRPGWQPPCLKARTPSEHPHPPTPQTAACIERPVSEHLMDESEVSETLWASGSGCPESACSSTELEQLLHSSFEKLSRRHKRVVRAIVVRNESLERLRRDMGIGRRLAERLLEEALASLRASFLNIV